MSSCGTDQQGLISSATKPGWPSHVLPLRPPPLPLGRFPLLRWFALQECRDSAFVPPMPAAPTDGTKLPYCFFKKATQPNPSRPRRREGACNDVPHAACNDVPHAECNDVPHLHKARRLDACAPPPDLQGSAAHAVA